MFAVRLRSAVSAVPSQCAKSTILSLTTRKFHRSAIMSETANVATLESIPAEGQTVEHKGTRYSTIKEGLAHILVPPNAKTVTDPKAPKDGSGETGQNVFYNPIQRFNRDLSVLAIRAFSEDFVERRKQRAESRSGAALNKRQRKNKVKAERQAKADVEKSGEQSKDAGVTATESAEVQTGPHPESIGTVTNKRKAEDELSKELNGDKKQKVDADQPEDVAIADAVSEGSDVPPALPKANGEIAIDPETASKAPTGERPDDKLRTKMRILDALSATGLRALRYASELPVPVSVTANDLLPTATESIKLNVKHNKLESHIKPITSDALAHMYQAAFGFNSHAYGKYDVIDLDPYGTAVPFLEAALLALNDGGLLCVTCTDAAVFNSMGYLEKTYALYGGLPAKGLHSHEVGLRLILNSIASTAAKHGLAIEPLLSLSIDFYARVWIRVHKAPSQVKFLSSKTMLLHNCDSGCGAWTLQPLSRTSTATASNGNEYFKYHAAQSSGEKRCEHCDSKSHVAGPMWGGPLHNPFFIAKVLGYLPNVSDETYGTKGRIEGMLTSALDELDVLPNIDSLTSSLASASEQLIPALPPQLVDPHPFSFSVSQLSRILHCVAPPEAAIKGALRHMGYVTTRSHTKPGMIKTQAPWGVVWEVMREWVKTKAPVKEGRCKEGTPGWKILLPLSEKEEEGSEAMKVEKAEAGKATDEHGKKGEQVGKRKITFDEVLGKDKPAAGGRKLVRYQINPRANWGPMSRAKG